MSGFISTLPPSVSSMERALEQVFWEEMALIEREIRDFLNPYKCRLDLLPYLAWELSVDDWGDSWSEEVKRKVCVNALTVHVYKGTRGAVEAALEALNIRAELTEWFEASPPLTPGRFTVRAWVNENLSSDELILSDAVYERIKSAVSNAKNTRSHFDFDVGALFKPEPIVMGNALNNGVTLTRRKAVAQQEMLLSRNYLGVAGHFQGVAVVYRKMEAQ